MSDSSTLSLDINQQTVTQPSLTLWQILYKALLVFAGLLLGALAGVFICLSAGWIELC
ncbi:hypothetical protein [Undibacterium umbellatum]|uniref:Chloride channel protein n=1 Tax=Undibacterium umbellatum TaxID=2762300 RepID=A0ABR6ZG73_9BURK|nr:hypothetical protein [Undibacterium umbellatum]MBC3910678.1 hypothetical protein [Undibacterium umbellatum]